MENTQEIEKSLSQEHGQVSGVKRKERATQDPEVPAKRNTKSRAYLVTWASFPEDYESIIKNCGADEYVYQLEKGKENGLIHVQAAVMWKNKKAFSAVKDLFEGAHIEKARNWHAAKQYCSKEDTRQSPTVSSKDPNNRVKDPLEGKELWPFQQELMSLLSEEPNDRTILWIWDPSGNVGKTSLAKHLCLKSAGCLYVTGKASDMKYACFSWTENAKNPDLRTVIINITRSQEMFISWQGVEEVKDGIFFNTKYESKMCLFNPPHVVMLANFRPDTDKLSADRWRIGMIDSVSRKVEWEQGCGP